MSDTQLPQATAPSALEASRAVFDASRKQRFLTLLRFTGQLQRSAQESGISPSTVKHHLKTDPDFKDAYEEAYEHFKESLETEAMRRAIMGWEEPVYQQGVLAGTVRKYDTRLLELLLKRHIPQFKEKYEATLNVSGGILAVPMPMTPEEWAHRHNAEGDAAARAAKPAECEVVTPEKDRSSLSEDSDAR